MLAPSISIQLTTVKAVAISSNKLGTDYPMIVMITERFHALHEANKNWANDQRAKRYPPYMLAVDASIESCMHKTKKEPRGRRPLCYRNVGLEHEGEAR